MSMSMSMSTARRVPWVYSKGRPVLSNGCTAEQVCVDIFQERGHHADVKNKLSVEQLHGIVGNYDGMVIRSATKVRRRGEGLQGTMKVEYPAHH